MRPYRESEVLSMKTEVLSAFRPRRAGVVYALIVIAVIFQLETGAQGLPSFLAVANVQNILDSAAIDGILVVSMTVLLITGNFDLSIGATAGLAGAVGLTVANGHGNGLGILAAVGVGLIVGLTNGVLVELVGVNAFIVTLGSYTALQGVLLTATNGTTILAEGDQFTWIGIGYWTIAQTAVILVGVLMIVGVVAWSLRLRTDSVPKQLLLSGNALGTIVVGASLVIVGVFVPELATQSRSTWVMLGYMTVAALVLRFTVLGRRVYAVGGNAEAARLSGISVPTYRIGAFVLTSVSASVAGMTYAGKFGAVDPTALVNEMLPVLAAAILGGTSLFGGAGYVLKSVIGTLILSTLTVGFNVLNLGSNYQYLVQGIVIIAAAAVYTVAGRRQRTVKIADRPVEEPAPVPSRVASH
jgi:D-xylose transport system permease protein